MMSFENTKLSRRTVLRGLGASLALPFVAATSSRGLCQLDPDERSYVLHTFTVDRESVRILVAKTGFQRYVAGKEYWNAPRKALHAISVATPGTVMSILGISYDWPEPSNFTHNFQMQDAVTWGTSAGPAGLSWSYVDPKTNTFVCIDFNIAKYRGQYHVNSIKWYLAARRAPQAKTYVFQHGPTYKLSYVVTPKLPEGFNWYGVTVCPGS